MAPAVYWFAAMALGVFVMFMMPESAPRKLATENTAVRSA
jgi:hypothetical protein